MSTNRIETYCRYFEEQLQNISLLKIPEQERLSNVQIPMYQKILLVTILDTLGRARFPDVQQNKDRFIRLVREASDWRGSNKISLPQLTLLLEVTSEPVSHRLTEEVRTRFGTWQSGHVYRIDAVDPSIADIIELAESDNERRIIRDAEHVNLLYKYRNHLVHEFREPGYGWEISDDGNSPYYHGMSSTGGIRSWELVYPRDFFFSIANSVLNNLKIHLQENNLDPYACYEFGTIWGRI